MRLEVSITGGSSMYSALCTKQLVLKNDKMYSNHRVCAPRDLPQYF